MKRKLAIVCNSLLLSETLQHLLLKKFAVERYNIFDLLLLQLENKNPINAIIYVVPDFFKEDKSFLKYCKQKNRLPIIVIGNNEDKRLFALQEYYHLELVLEFSSRNLNLIDEVKGLLKNEKPIAYKSIIKNRFGLTAKEILLLQLYGGKHKKQDIAETHILKHHI